MLKLLLRHTSNTKSAVDASLTYLENLALRTDLDAPSVTKQAKVRISVGYVLETGKVALYKNVETLIATQLIIETPFCKAVGPLR